MIGDAELKEATGAFRAKEKRNTDDFSRAHGNEYDH
jgi:hypothetical protein